MKKLLLLPLLLILFSCSSEEGPKDPIVGTWKYVKYLDYPVNSEEVLTKEASKCQLLTRMTFRKSNNLTTSYYINNPLNGECDVNTSATKHDLSWEKLSDGQYRIYSEEYPKGSLYNVDFIGDSEMRFIWNRTYTKYTTEGEFTIEKSEEVYIRI